MRTMAIDFIRQVIEQTLYIEHLKNSKYFGGVNQVNLFSFYEQLKEDYEVNRYTEIYDDLLDQQNRTGLIMNGTIVAPENPTITNLNSALIIPMVFTCSFRVALANRDSAIETINNMIDKLRARKQDVAQFDNGKLFMVGTSVNNAVGEPILENGSYIGEFNSNTDDIDAGISQLLASYYTGRGISVLSFTWGYIEDTYTGKLTVVSYNTTSAKWEIKTTESTDYILPPEHNSFTKYKISFSFDTIRVDQPLTLNSEEYCTISIGGSATLCDAKILLGNELTKLGVRKLKIKAQSVITLANDNTNPTFWLEPLEMSSGLGISNELSQLVSSKFIQNKHNDGINSSFDYAFVVDRTNTLIMQLFHYARYGIQGTNGGSYLDGVTPNMIYKVTEIWSSWGNVDIRTFNAKITENIDVENTESDTLTIKTTFELQAD